MVTVNEPEKHLRRTEIHLPLREGCILVKCLKGTHASTSPGRNLYSCMYNNYISKHAVEIVLVLCLIKTRKKGLSDFNTYNLIELYDFQNRRPLLSEPGRPAW